MSRICANCKIKQGPFQNSWSTWAIPICRKTKANPNRLQECVDRRDKIDAQKYKELMAS